MVFRCSFTSILVLLTLSGCSAWLFAAPKTNFDVRYKCSVSECPIRVRSKQICGLRMAEPSTASAVNHGSLAHALQLFSPAKTNLFLRITRKRDDGFHELASVFQALGLGDTLTFEKLENGESLDVLTCNEPSVPLDEKNLVTKAFSLFRKKTGIKAFFRCDIDKQTPLEGGMGGGSSNAATALWAANKLSGSPASDASLIEWGGELGRWVCCHGAFV